MNKKNTRNFLLLLLIVFVALVGCSKDDEFLSLEEYKNKEEREAAVIQFINESNKPLGDLVTNQYLYCERVLDTDNFLYIAYVYYPEDEIVKTIYNLNRAKFDKRSWNRRHEMSDFDSGRGHAAEMSKEYDGELIEEVEDTIEFFLGDDPDAERALVYEENERFDKMTEDEKIAVKNYMFDRYDYYDEIEDKYTGDEYTEKIWEETSLKFNIPHRFINEINIYTKVPADE